MKKLLLTALAAAALFACGKDNDNNPAPTPDPDPEPEVHTILELEVYNSLNWDAAHPLGTLAAGVTVELFKTQADFNSDDPAYTDTTDANGKATFTGLDAGVYYIAARTDTTSNMPGALLVDGAYVGYKADTLYQTDEDAQNAAFSGYNAPGNFWLEDLNMDLIINNSDRIALPWQSVTVVADVTTTGRRIVIGKLDNHQ
ncbi:prealbumin-like fold domain-containing protein [Chitinophaga japonensis]|nr:prealbumin-like fold domain-containing protein [Chitinophaga japonensis]